MDLDNLEERLHEMPIEDAAKVVINLLEPLPFAVVRYTYYGSDDSLSSDSLDYYETWEDYLAGDRTFRGDGDQADPNPIPTKLAEGIMLVAGAIIERHHGGWENNDGGHGKVDFIVKPAEGETPRVILKHWNYEQIEHFGGTNVY